MHVQPQQSFRGERPDDSLPSIRAAVSASGPGANRREREGGARKIARWFGTYYRRARAKNVRQLSRAIGMRIWPLSEILHRHHRARMGPDGWTKINEKAREIFERQPPDLDEVQRRAVEALRRDGLHMTTLRDLLGSSANLQRLIDEADALLSRPAVQRQLEARRSEDGAKWYVIRAFGLKRPRLPIPRVFADLVVSDKILGIANAYLGVSSRLKYFDLWCNIPAGTHEPPIDSERWHRDNEDRNLLKIFLYLSKVDETSGPVNYLCGTQPGGRFGSIYPNDPPAASYPPAGALEKLVPAGQAQCCVGDEGTVIMYDACGFHFGGRASVKPRVLLVATYASDAAIDLQRYHFEDQGRYESANEAARYAIGAASD